MPRVPLDAALISLGPEFMQEVHKRMAPVKDRFFQIQTGTDSQTLQDGLHTPPPYLADPELRKVAVELVELALANGIDVNLACQPDGSTILHECVLLRDSALAEEAVAWLLAHGADPNRRRDHGESPLSLAAKSGRTTLVNRMRRNSL